MNSPTRQHHFMGKSIDLPDNLSEAQLDGCACVCCGAEDQPTRPVEAWGVSVSGPDIASFTRTSRRLSQSRRRRAGDVLKSARDFR